MTETSIPDSITTLDEAITFLQFTRDENGLYFYDAGHPEPWEADENTVRQEMQMITLYNIMPENDNSEEQQNAYRHNQLVHDAMALILKDILARPGYVPLAEQPESEWKTELRAQKINTLHEALIELAASEEDGVFFSSEDEYQETIIFTEEFLEEEIERAKSNMPENDELTFFYPYQYGRLYIEAMEVLLKEVKNRR